MTVTHEEMTLVRESVLLPFILPIVARNISELEKGNNKDKLLHRLYLTTAKRLHNEIEADIRKINKTLREQNIRVWEDEKRAREEGSRFYRYSCRGYEDSFGFMRDVVKAEIGTRLKLYVLKIEKAFNQRI